MAKPSRAGTDFLHVVSTLENLGPTELSMYIYSKFSGEWIKILKFSRFRLLQM